MRIIMIIMVPELLKFILTRERKHEKSAKELILSSHVKVSKRKKERERANPARL